MATKARVKTERRVDRKRENCLQVWNLPPGLKKQFKLTCVQREVSIHDAVVKMLREYCGIQRPQ
jgi:hypothetical protein